MSNFLARIAASVLQTQTATRPRLQPMLGSIYAPGAAFTPGDSSFSTTPLAHDTESASRTAPTSVFAAPQNNVRPHYGDTSHNEPRGTYTNAEQSQDLSVKDRSHRYPGAEASLLQATPFSSQTSPVTKSSVVEKTTRQRIEVTDPSLHLSTIAQPLMPYAPPAVRITPLRSAPAAIHTQRTASNSEPDEIHIHIGRVEVAAVTPPAPRPAAAPPRRSINLEEYLRHSNGGHA